MMNTTTKNNRHVFYMVTVAQVSVALLLFFGRGFFKSHLQLTLPDERVAATELPPLEREDMDISREDAEKLVARARTEALKELQALTNELEKIEQSSISNATRIYAIYSNKNKRQQIMSVEINLNKFYSKIN